MSERLAPIVDETKPHNSKSPMPKLLLTGGILYAMIACIPVNDQSPTVWNDPGLAGGRPDRGLTSLQMRLDFQHNPAGSVRMETCYNEPGKFRVVSEEKSPRPGILVDKTLDHKAQCYPEVWPVSPIDNGDHEIINLGLGNTSEQLSTGARSYDVTRTGKNTLNIKPLPPTDLGKPGSLKMRDATQ